MDSIEQYQKEGLVQIRNELKPEASIANEDSGEYTSLCENSSEKNEELVADNTNELTTGNKKELVEVKLPPVVVHCSAGVGRTGTFCCLSNSIERLHATGNIDIFSTVKLIRDQRAFSVQTPEQYQFCYTGIIEYIIRERHEKEIDTERCRHFCGDFLHGDLSSDSD